MPCASCGALTRVVEDSTGNTKEGPFTEDHECLNGHRGTVTGEASEPPQQWSRTGAVFNEDRADEIETRA